MSRTVQRAAGVLLVACLLLIPSTSALAVPAGEPVAVAAAKKKSSKKKYTVRCTTKKVRGKRKRVCKRVPVKKKPAPKKQAPSGGGGGTTPPSGTSGGGGAAPAPQPPAEDAATRFRKALTGSRLYSIQHSSSSTSSSSVEETFDFCDGVYSYRKDTNASSGNVYQKGWRGTWRVVEAAYNADGSVAQGRIAYTSDQSTSYAYVNGANDTSEAPPQDGEVIITLTAAGPAYVGQQEFSRSASPACG